MRTGITNPSRTRLSKEGKISFANVSSTLKSSIYLLVAKLTATLHVFFFPSLNTCYLSPAFLGSVARCPSPSVPALLRAKPQEQFGLGLLRVQYAVSCFGHYFLLLKRILHSLCSGFFIGNICIFTCLQKKGKNLSPQLHKIFLPFSASHPDLARGALARSPRATGKTFTTTFKVTLHGQNCTMNVFFFSKSRKAS